MLLLMFQMCRVEIFFFALQSTQQNWFYAIIFTKRVIIIEI